MKKVKIPTNCPSCDSALTRVNDQLFCTNEECSGILVKKLLHYAKVASIKGLGPKTIEKLNLMNIEDMYTISREEIVEVMGDKIGTKLADEIDKARKLDRITFITALNIPLVGRAIASKIQKPMDELTEDYLRSVGVGQKATNNILEFISNGKHILPVEVLNDDEMIVGDLTYNVCITGKITGHTKLGLSSELLNYNIRTTTNVTKETNYLICDMRKNSSKEQLAMKYNIPIVTYKEFKEILKND